MGQFLRNSLFLQAFYEGRDRGGIFGKSRLISNAYVLSMMCKTPRIQQEPDFIIEDNRVHIADVPVFATGLKKQGIHGLLGRDVLQHMLLVYNGYSGHLTLAVSSTGDTSTPCYPLEHITLVSLLTLRNQRL